MSSEAARPAWRVGLAWAKYPMILGLVIVAFGVLQGDGVQAAKGILVMILLGIPLFIIGFIAGLLRRQTAN